MPIPKTRDDLVTGIERRYRALSETLDSGPDDLPWTGKWPIARWISVSTETQWDSARKAIRKAAKS